MILIKQLYGCLLILSMWTWFLLIDSFELLAMLWYAMVSWGNLAKTLRSSIFAEFLSCSVLSGEAQPRTLPCYQSDEMKIFNIWDLLMGIEPTIVEFTVARLRHCATMVSIIAHLFLYNNKTFLNTNYLH